jgi:hypothetical protein
MSKSAFGNSSMKRKNVSARKASSVSALLRTNATGSSKNSQLSEPNANSMTVIGNLSRRLFCKDRPLKRSKQGDSIKCRNRLSSTMNSEWPERLRR